MLTFPDAIPKFQATLQTMSIHQSSIYLQIHDAEAYYPAGNPVRFSDYYAPANGLKQTRVNLNPHYVRSRPLGRYYIPDPLFAVGFDSEE